MRIYHWQSEHGNFGDDLNQFLWPHFMPELVDDDPDTLLVGVGTVLSDDLPAARRRIVLGSGIGYGRLPADLDAPCWDIRAVRGPLSARVLGRPDLAAADPAVLLPLMPDFPAPPARAGTVFVPHWTTAAAGSWQAACAAAGVEFLDPRGDAHDVIRRIAAADRVIAESMHGAIVADAFRVPWVAVVTGRDTPFKWHDWAGALGLRYAPLVLGSLDQPGGVAKARLRGYRPVLRAGDDAAIEAAHATYMARYAPQAPRPRAPSLRARLRPAINRALALTETRQRITAHGAAMLDHARRHPPALSDDAALKAGQDKLLACIETLRAEARALPV